MKFQAHRGVTSWVTVPTANDELCAMAKNMVI